MLNLLSVRALDHALFFFILLINPMLQHLILAQTKTPQEQAIMLLRSLLNLISSNYNVHTTS
jgi:hypothetical protein